MQKIMIVQVVKNMKMTPYCWNQRTLKQRIKL